MNPQLQHALTMTRRQLFSRSATGLGTAALATLLGKELLGADSPAAPAPGGASPIPAHLAHFAPKAKRIVYMLHGGAPSHVDLFDYKESVGKYSGQQLPDSVRQG